MPKKLLEIGKFIGWAACTIGGFASFLQWLEIKPKDLAMSQSIPVPHTLLLLFAFTLFSISIGTATWSGIVQRRELKRLKTNPNPPLPANLPSNRLKIISAKWGIEGINVFDVTSDVLERQHGDSYAEPVVPDLFHRRDPVSGKAKVLTVRYSFDGREATIIRPEYAWLFLPEDTFLKERVSTLQMELQQARKVESISISDSDPLIYPEFTDARGKTGSDKKENEAYFTLVNRGGAEARNVVLEPMEMDGKIIQFTRHRIAAPLLPKREAYFYPDVVTTDNKSVAENAKDLFGMFCRDYLAPG